MKRFLLFLIVVACGACSFLWGCEENATSTLGEFVPNLEGDYDLVNLTADADCTGEFGEDVSITQDEANFVMRPVNPAFTNLNGTIDELGVITATGATSFATPFDCTGQFAADTFSGICHSEFQVTVIDDAGDATTIDVTIDCAFSYLRN